MDAQSHLLYLTSDVHVSYPPAYAPLPSAPRSPVPPVLAARHFDRAPSPSDLPLHHQTALEDSGPITSVIVPLRRSQRT